MQCIVESQGVTVTGTVTGTETHLLPLHVLSAVFSMKSPSQLSLSSHLPSPFVSQVVQCFAQAETAQMVHGSQVYVSRAC